MDMFMDKLAQRLTAQEIIKANTAADAEELNKLKDRVAEYNECLDKLQKLITDGGIKLENAQVNGEELNRLIEESIQKIQAMQQDTASLEALQQKFAEQLAAMETAVAERQASSEQVLLGHVADRMNASDENVHKECVKVYRNVQAVVVEEGGKQSEVLTELSAKVGSMKGKLGAILGISITALILSLGSVVMSVLEMLNISLF